MEQKRISSKDHYLIKMPPPNLAVDGRALTVEAAPALALPPRRSAFDPVNPNRKGRAPEDRHQPDLGQQPITPKDDSAFRVRRRNELARRS